MGEEDLKTCIVEEPDDGDGGQSEPVVLEDQSIRGRAAHRFLGELLRLLEAKTEDEKDEWENNTDSQASTPDDFKMLAVGGGSDDVWIPWVSKWSRAIFQIFASVQGIKAPMTKPTSIMEFVNRMNQRLRVPRLSSPVDSAQPTLPAGYSPVRTKLAGKFDEAASTGRIAHLQCRYRRRNARQPAC